MRRSIPGRLLKLGLGSSNVCWSEKGSIMVIHSEEGLVRGLQKGRETPMKIESLERRLRVCFHDLAEDQVNDGLTIAFEYLGWHLTSKEVVVSESTSLGSVTRVKSSWVHACLTRSSSCRDFVFRETPSLREERPLGSAGPLLEISPQAAERSTNELEVAAEALLALGRTCRIPTTSISNAVPSTDRLSEREDPAPHGEAYASWSNKDMEEIAMLSEAAGIHTCKLDLIDCLILDDWYAYFGTFMMPSSACLSDPAGCVSCDRLFGGA